MKTTPVRGMKDILPREMQIREYVTQVIKDTYRAYGFVGIETPCVEHIENLESSQGGENEKLIFKIMKRGEKAESVTDVNSLVDSGLRYDLTLPLARYYAQNTEQLPSPFMALQIGSVWRADRPQRGRFRQFTQCDIDILGDSSTLAELTLIEASCSVLLQLGFTGFTLRMGDRRILSAMANYAGFAEDRLNTVLIILDKLDKIGVDGVRAELIDAGFSAEGVDKYMSLFTEGSSAQFSREYLGDTLAGYLEDGITDRLDGILGTARRTAQGRYNVVFDPTLVRGMGYYTGTIMEMQIDGFPGSVGGGGRYDKMIGRFVKTDTSAVGFSIGFERIITILSEANFTIPNTAKAVAFLVEKGADAARISDIMAEASTLRATGINVLVTQRKKNTKAQKDSLRTEGYTEIREFFNN